MNSGPADVQPSKSAFSICCLLFCLSHLLLLFATVLIFVAYIQLLPLLSFVAVVVCFRRMRNTFSSVVGFCRFFFFLFRNVLTVILRSLYAQTEKLQIYLLFFTSAILSSSILSLVSVT